MVCVRISHAEANTIIIALYKHTAGLKKLQVSIVKLKEADRIVPYGDAGNYSVTGFELKLERNVAKLGMKRT